MSQCAIMPTYMRPSAATPAQQLRRTVFYLDGLRYCFAMADVAAQRLRGTLDEVVLRHSAHEDYEKEVASALLDAWSLVDVCHRARELVQQTPGLSPRRPGGR